MPSRRRQPSTPPGPKTRAAVDPWVLFLVSLAAMLALGPCLGRHLGEFWGQAAFLPIWAVFYFLIHIIRLGLEVRHDRR